MKWKQNNKIDDEKGVVIQRLLDKVSGSDHTTSTPTSKTIINEKKQQRPSMRESEKNLFLFRYIHKLHNLYALDVLVGNNKLGVMGS